MPKKKEMPEPPASASPRRDGPASPNPRFAESRRGGEPSAAVKPAVYQKIATVAVVIFLIFLAVLLILNREYQWFNKEAGQKLAEAEVNSVNPVQLEKDYREKFTQIIGDFTGDFAASRGLAKSDLLAKTEKAQDEVSALLVPSKYKDSHLAAVLLLGGLTDGINKDDQAIISAKLTNLEDLLAKF